MKKSLLFMVLLSITSLYATETDGTSESQNVSKSEFFWKRAKDSEAKLKGYWKKFSDAEDAFFVKHWGKIAGLYGLNVFMRCYGWNWLKYTDSFYSYLHWTDGSARDNNGKSIGRLNPYGHFNVILSLVFIYAQYKKIRSLEARVN